jgi:uroporphyrinogen decarboxylase-like protein
MPANPTPRQILTELLQGIAQPRPLWLPIVFSLGAKMENLPPGSFLGNATKISNSMRQIRSHLRSDGLSCYFDPYLEAEALGGVLKWNPENQRPSIAWPGHAEKGELPEDLHSPEDAMRRGRVGVAIEVVRRLRSLERDDSLLAAGVTGPFTLATRITQLEHEPSLAPSEASLEVAASTMERLSGAFAEAGANVIFIQEEVLPRVAADSCEGWAARLAPAFNIIRFYQALPVLQLTNSRAFAENSEIMIQQNWNCVLCHTVEFPPSMTGSQMGDVMRGIAIPPEVLVPEKVDDQDLDRVLDYVMSEWRPAIVTTSGGVPVDTDMKRLIRISERVRSRNKM